jgi:hypothetical protein
MSESKCEVSEMRKAVRLGGVLLVALLALGTVMEVQKGVHSVTPLEAMMAFSSHNLMMDAKADVQDCGDPIHWAYYGIQWDASTSGSPPPLTTEVDASWGVTQGLDELYSSEGSDQGSSNAYVDDFQWVAHGSGGQGGFTGGFSLHAWIYSSHKATWDTLDPLDDTWEDHHWPVCAPENGGGNGGNGGS